jgi:predicted  nucleic acid-binding Zn-ribbon protein
VSQTAGLYHLQKLDSQADGIRQRLTEIAELLGQDEALRSAQQALTDTQQSLSAWHTRQTGLEMERATIQEEAQATESRLYSGNIPNPRELTDLQDKLVELNKRIETLEEPILEAMLAIEDHNQQVAAGREELEHITGEQAHKFGELGEERARLSAQLDGLLAEANAARSKIPAQYLEMYDRIRKRPGGLAVTLLKGDECGICGVELTSQLAQQVRRGEVLICPTCNRILHVA